MLGHDENNFYRHQLCCHWSGVYDVHSGLSYMEWWAGTAPGGSDLIPSRHLNPGHDYVCEHVTEALPLNTKIYISLKVVNNAGMYFVLFVQLNNLNILKYSLNQDNNHFQYLDTIFW